MLFLYWAIAIVAIVILWRLAVKGYIAGLVFLCMAIPGSAWHKIKQTVLSIGDMLGLVRFNKKLMSKRGSCEDDIYDRLF